MSQETIYNYVERVTIKLDTVEDYNHHRPAFHIQDFDPISSYVHLTSQTQNDQLGTDTPSAMLSRTNFLASPCWYQSAWYRKSGHSKGRLLPGRWGSLH